MNYDFNEEQNLLKESARKFLSDECPATYVRRMAADERGCSEDVWNKMVELGWLGLPFPEEYGGSGMDFLHLAVLLAEMGYACMPGPFFSTVVLGGLAVLEGGTEAQKKRILEEVSAGRRVVTLAWIEEDGACSEESVRMRAERRGDRYRLSGVKVFVPDAHVAGTIVCAARTEKPDSGLRLFLVDPSGPGVAVHRMETLSGDRLCEVVLDGATVAEEDVLGGLAAPGAKVLRSVLLKAAVAKCAELSGGARRVLEIAVGYAKERIQFGRPIGAFQAVQHHCANMLTYADTIHFMTFHAAWKIARALPFEKEAAMCKAWVSDSYRKLVALGHQVLGGIGFMEEHDLHLYFAQAKAGEVMFGDGDFHREQVASLLGL